MSSASNGKTASTCQLCQHFYITYEPRTPRGCKAYGFKSREMPNRVVYASSGEQCRLFCPRSKRG
ncbi:MAG: hypothetical protein CSA33_03020 [Desulfobulbus propionicus]|nr:MAG: hypothetical protein CSA33_03020 [Desulfobulbus propionicus]